MGQNLLQMGHFEENFAIRRWVAHLQMGNPSADLQTGQTHLQMGQIDRWFFTYAQKRYDNN